MPHAAIRLLLCILQCHMTHTTCCHITYTTFYLITYSKRLERLTSTALHTPTHGFAPHSHTGSCLRHSAHTHTYMRAGTTPPCCPPPPSPPPLDPVVFAVMRCEGLRENVEVLVRLRRTFEILCLSSVGLPVVRVCEYMYIHIYM